jgi:predicted DNA-binding transcriptional regulator YafY
MNRTDRLFAITLLLRSKRRVRAQDLAETFEVSLRTIYRDVAALSEAGVPIVSLPSQGYELMEGFYLPPLVFTPSEASALFLGTTMLANQAAGQLPSHAETALAKIAAVLPNETRGQVERLTEIIEFYLPKERFNLDDPRLLTLRQAILERRAVWLCYHSYSGNETTERVVEPHSLTYSGSVWYVSGYCRLRQDSRGFRFDRIEQLRLLEEQFEARTVESAAPEPVTIRVRFAESVVRWVRERQHYGFVEVEAPPNGDGFVMVYRVDAFSEMVPWLLSWGASAEVLSPGELRDQIRREAIELAEMLT